MGHEREGTIRTNRVALDCRLELAKGLIGIICVQPNASNAPQNEELYPVTQHPCTMIHKDCPVTQCASTTNCERCAQDKIMICDLPEDNKEATPT